MKAKFTHKAVFNYSNNVSKPYKLLCTSRPIHNLQHYYGRKKLYSFKWKYVTCPECQKDERYKLHGKGKKEEKILDKIMVMLESKINPKLSSVYNVKNAIITELINEIRITFRKEINETKT